MAKKRKQSRVPGTTRDVIEVTEENYETMLRREHSGSERVADRLADEQVFLEDCIWVLDRLQQSVKVREDQEDQGDAREGAVWAEDRYSDLKLPWAALAERLERAAAVARRRAAAT